MNAKILRAWSYVVIAVLLSVHVVVIYTMVTESVLCVSGAPTEEVCYDTMTDAGYDAFRLGVVVTVITMICLYTVSTVYTEQAREKL